MVRKSARRKTARAEWLATSPEQRSFVVRVLRWFYFRSSTHLKRPWVSEEVLTWELLLVLQLLPQTVFLRPLLHEIAQLSPRTQRVVSPLLAVQRIEVFRYPSLKLEGSKKNCRSDIGIGTSIGATLWLEAKTAPFNKTTFRKQLDQQRRALSSQFPRDPTALVTLLPERDALRQVPNLSWTSVASALHAGIEKLRATGLSDDVRYGYERLAMELAERIESHPNRIAKSGH